MLRVGGSALMLARVLVAFTVGYRRRYPHIDVSLIEEVGPRLAARLHCGDCAAKGADQIGASRFRRQLLAQPHEQGAIERA